mmetsp:Transcript_113237/g.283560  ORF Transcript_113237/g.283560 Transcript_113237/m.283560 type:complete len:203 (+) Transcript_113237:843-1451(+)
MGAVYVRDVVDSDDFCGWISTNKPVHYLGILDVRVDYIFLPACNERHGRSLLQCRRQVHAGRARPPRDDRDRDPLHDEAEPELEPEESGARVDPVRARAAEERGPFRGEHRASVERGFAAQIERCHVQRLAEALPTLSDVVPQFREQHSRAGDLQILRRQRQNLRRRRPRRVDVIFALGRRDAQVKGAEVPDAERPPWLVAP